MGCQRTCWNEFSDCHSILRSIRFDNSHRGKQSLIGVNDSVVMLNFIFSRYLLLMIKLEGLLFCKEEQPIAMVISCKTMIILR